MLLNNLCSDKGREKKNKMYQKITGCNRIGVDNHEEDVCNIFDV